MPEPHSKFRLILYAPNIHIGGGLALLREVLNSKNSFIHLAQLDKRAKGALELPTHTAVHYVRNTVFSRLLAELNLWYHSKLTDTVLCFHSLPPLLPIRGRVIVFVQNRLLLEHKKLSGYPLKTKLRIFIERLWIKKIQQNPYRYIVQTPSMAIAAKRYLKNDVNVTVFPFVPSIDSISASRKSGSQEKKFDFVYVADGEVHKNHINLLKAWNLLADAGLNLSLAVTVDPQRYPVLAREISRYAEELDGNIINFKKLDPTAISSLYQASSALIFPSLTESFGLPLAEASQHRLPILASERDFVRDLVAPVQTFDPSSPLSIARAIRRFLGDSEPLPKMHSTEEFLKEIMA